MEDFEHFRGNLDIVSEKKVITLFQNYVILKKRKIWSLYEDTSPLTHSIKHKEESHNCKLKTRLTFILNSRNVRILHMYMIIIIVSLKLHTVKGNLVFKKSAKLLLARSASLYRQEAGLKY